MDELKETIAKNLVELRTQARLTQLQLAEKLNYSDKAVSKWERGEAIPDIRVLIKLAEIYNITVDDILTDSAAKKVKPKMHIGKKRVLITLLSVGLACFVATVIFMIVFFIPQTAQYAYLVYICLPFACSVVLMVFSVKWGNWIRNIVASSLLVWTSAVIFQVFVNEFTADFDKMYFMYIVAGSFEILIILWFTLRKLYKRKK